MVCEKPLGLNYGEVKEMVDLARAKDVFFMEAIWSRSFPLYQAVMEVIAKGDIGEVRTRLSTYCLGSRKKSYLFHAPGVHSRALLSRFLRNSKG